MLPILFHPQAAFEASIAADWYEFQQQGLGNRFENDLQKTARDIQNNPLIYAAEKHNERLAAFRDFPYSLIFKVYHDRIWVSCVSHHKRRPGYWRKRKSS
jgi:toxin ParE1/3/4